MTDPIDDLRRILAERQAASAEIARLDGELVTRLQGLVHHLEAAGARSLDASQPSTPSAGATPAVAPAVTQPQATYPGVPVSQPPGPSEASAPQSPPPIQQAPYPQQAPSQLAPYPQQAVSPPAPSGQAPSGQAWPQPVGEPYGVAPVGAPVGTSDAQFPPAPPAGPATPPVWDRPGFAARVLAVAGGAVTLLGVAFLLVLAAQYGYFGPLARTVAAAVLGAVLVALGFVVRGRDAKNPGAPILAATGIAAAFLSVVTATAIYGWLSPLVGAVLAGLVGLGGIALARWWVNEWVAVVAVAGALALAAYVGSDQPVPTAGLMVLFTAVTMVVGQGLEWRVLPFARILPTAAALALVSDDPFDLFSPAGWWVLGLDVAFALVALLPALLDRSATSHARTINLALTPVATVPLAMAALFVPSHPQGALALGVVAIAYSVVGFLPATAPRVQWAALPVGAFAAVLALILAFDLQYSSILLPVVAVVYLALSLGTGSRVVMVVGVVLGILGLGWWMPLLGLLLGELPVAAMGPEQVIQSTAVLAACVLGAMAALRFGASAKVVTYAGWGAAILTGSVTILVAATWVGGALGTPRTGFQVGHLLVTITWMLLCIFFLGRGLMAGRGARVWLRLALVVAGLAVAKLFLIDLGMLDAVVRVAAFLITGLLLLFVGTRYAKAWDRVHGSGGDEPPVPAVAATPPPPPAPAPPPPRAPAPPPPPPHVPPHPETPSR